MARMGMDADAVESAGRVLKERAGQIDAIVSGLDRSVKGLLNIWDGPDAQTFVNKWWPEHRSLLVTARGHVDGLGQSALNNASEQRGASNVKGDHGTSPNAGPGTPTPSTTPTTSGRDDFGWWRSKYPDGTSAQVDYDGNGIQCVDLIKQYAHDLYGPGAVVAANGNEVWANYGSTGHYDQIAAGATPQAGDIICIDAWPAHMGSDENPWGHTAVVDHVDPNGTVWMVNQSGSEQSRGIFVTQLSDFYKPYLQGYLRPKV